MKTYKSLFQFNIGKLLFLVEWIIPEEKPAKRQAYEKEGE